MILPALSLYLHIYIDKQKEKKKEKFFHIIKYTQFSLARSSETIQFPITNK